MSDPVAEHAGCGAVVADITATGQAPPAGPADPGVVDLNEYDVVPAALARLRDAARACCHAAARNGFYPVDLAVQVLADSTAALAVLADHVAPYAGDFWPAAGTSVDAARAALTAARQDLDTARRHMALTPAEDQQAVGARLTCTTTAPLVLSAAVRSHVCVIRFGSAPAGLEACAGEFELDGWTWCGAMIGLCR